MQLEAGTIIVSLKIKDRNFKARRGSVTSSHTKTVVTDHINGRFALSQ